MKALGEFLRPEFINRVDEIITFRSLDENDFVAIAKIMINDLRTVLTEKDISLSVSESALELIAKKSFSRRFGARAMRRFIQTDVEDVIANEIIGSYEKHFTAVSIDSDGEKLTFADAKEFPYWSADAIAFVSASVTSSSVIASVSITVSVSTISSVS